MSQRPTFSLPFALAGIVFCICLIASNLLAIKQVMVGPLVMTGALIVFPISYIINDCIVEVWGYRRARLLIWTGFVMNFLFAVFGMLADALPRSGMVRRVSTPSSAWHRVLPALRSWRSSWARSSTLMS